MYSRVLLGVAFVLAEVLMWITKARLLFYPTLGLQFGFSASLCLGFPAAFVILWVMVRTIPRMVPPKLVLRHFGTVMTLDLSPDSRESSGGSRYPNNDEHT